MKRLWSPWRMEYLLGEEKKIDGCIFCHKLASENDRDNLVVHRGAHAAILMNLYPYNNGHLMVIPYVHEPTTEELGAETLLEMMELVNFSMAILHRVMAPRGFNVGVNIGTAAGAGIADHVHMHIVPRWDGDTNFLLVCAETRVVPELLPDTYEKLVNAARQLLDPTG